MNIENSRIKDQWLPCDEGAIQDASASIQNRQVQNSRRQFLRAAAQASVVVAGVGFTGWALFGQDGTGGGLRAVRNNPNYPGGIACSEVIRQLSKYIDNSLTDADLVSSIEAHLPKCNHCCQIHDKMIQDKQAA